MRKLNEKFSSQGPDSSLVVAAVFYRFAYRRYSALFVHPVRTAHGSWTEREGILVRLDCEDGRVGFGEAAPITWFGTESIDAVETACRSLGDKISEDVCVSLPTTVPTLHFALYSAIHDAKAKQPSVDSTNMVVQPQYLPVAALLPAGKTVLQKVEGLLEAGFRCFKWKVGVGDVADELSLLDDLLARLPAGAKLRLDANGAWDRRQAERWLDRAAERPIEFIEQPIAPGERGSDDMLQGLAEDYPTPLALDESIVTAAQIELWLGRGWPGLYVIKPAFLEDPAQTLPKIPPRSRVFSSSLETAIGAKAALRTAFQYCGNEPRAIGFGVYPLFQDGRLNGPAHAPFIRAADVERIDPAETWNALS